jgi:carboxyl-terminal processing protease
MSIVMKKSVTTIALAFSLMFSPSFNFEPVNLPILHTPIALAADYGSLTDEQKAVAEAWRIVDNNFIDRTFNNQDWWKIRQDMVKKKYKNMGEAQAEIDKMVSTLGDKYTRYLPPSKYRSIVDSATGTLAGVGVEITSDKETGKILVADTEPSSPASRGGIRKGDVFIEVDGARFDDNGKSTPDDVASKLRGPEGSRGK